MNQERYSLIAHRFLPYSAPISEAAVGELLRILPLSAADSILDVGCGRGALLLQFVQRFGCRGLGLDTSARALDLARHRTNELGLGSHVAWICERADNFDPARPVSLGICVGASHAFGGFEPMCRKMASWVQPGGWLLLGEGFWEKTPEPDYLETFGAEVGELGSHFENVVRPTAHGFTIAWSRVSSQADWDHYEGLYRFGMVRHLLENPADPDWFAFGERSASWYYAYLKWGRETMGFGLYLFQKAPAEARAARG